tara:strand:- start:2176 stop:2454 length:279 start_codon:yes stop_codon:yes gene_type:complete
MAKFIAIKSSGAGLAGGDVLLGVEGIISVDAGSATTTVVEYDAKKITITHLTVGTTPSVRDAVNAALTANPGGVKARVQLPVGITVAKIVTT